MKRLLLCLCLLAAPVWAQLPPGYAVQTQMRDTGYVLGDFLDQQIRIALPRGARLDEASLPAIGPVNHWLELRERRLHRSGGDYQLQLRYQVFAAVEEPLQLAVPGFALRLSGESALPKLQVPPQPFYLSPVLPATLDEKQRQPRASLAPLQESTRLPTWGLALSLGAGLLLALYLAWLYDRLPWVWRGAGPFARLLRRWRGGGDGEYAALLREVQHGFNACAGETLYADNLPLLFARAPYLLPLREDIEALLAHARGVFYEGREAQAEWPATRVLALCRRLRERERGAR